MTDIQDMNSIALLPFGIQCRCHTVEKADALHVVMELGKIPRHTKEPLKGKIYGHIEGYIYPNDEARITWVGTDHNYTGKGIGQYLILMFSEYAKGRGCKTIELDDDSDLARTGRSIYLKLGFEYVEEGVEEPEMIGYVDNIMKKKDSILEHICTRGFFSSI